MNATKNPRAAVRGFKRYPAYKDTNIEWLGSIPSHWEVRRLKYLASLNPVSLSEETSPDFEMVYVDIGGVDSRGNIAQRESLRFSSAPSRARALKNFLFDQYLRAHRQAEELIKRGESKTLEFKSTLRWSLKDNKHDDKFVTHAVVKTVAAFLNTEGGDLLIGVADDGGVVGTDHDQLESDDKFMRHLAQVVRNGLGDRAGTCIDSAMQIVDGKTVCLVSCQRSPEPVFLKWKGLEKSPEGDFFVRSGPGTVALPSDSAKEYIRTRFPSA